EQLLRSGDDRALRHPHAKAVNEAVLDPPEEARRRRTGDLRPLAGPRRERRGKRAEAGDQSVGPALGFARPGGAEKRIEQRAAAAGFFFSESHPRNLAAIARLR